MSTKPRNLGIRLDAHHTDQLERFEAKTGIEGTTLFRNAGYACLAYWEEQGRISFPLELIEKSADGTKNIEKPSNRSEKKSARETMLPITTLSEPLAEYGKKKPA